jgi:hypothetical protein
MAGLKRKRPDRRKPGVPQVWLRFGTDALRLLNTGSGLNGVNSGRTGGMTGGREMRAWTFDPGGADIAGTERQPSSSPGINRLQNSLDGVSSFLYRESKENR